MIKQTIITACFAVMLPALALAQFSGGGGGGGSGRNGIGGTTPSTPGPDGVVNVKNYGVKGDGQMFTDGVMNNGSPTLSVKQPIVSTAVSGTTVTVTLKTNGFTLGVPGQPQPPPNDTKWIVGSNVTIAGVSGGSGFNGTFPISAIPSATTFQYVATASGSGTGGVASTISPFTVADVGKLICVQGVASGGVKQKCGTISAFVDSQDVTLSFNDAYAGTNAVALNFVYASDDTAALTSVLSNTTLPEGGIVFFPAGLYGISNTLQIPTIGSWTIMGSGSGAMGQNFNGNIGFSKPTTGLMVLTTGMAHASGAVMFGTGIPGPTQNFIGSLSTIRDIGIFGGAGWGKDGGVGDVTGNVVFGIYVNQSNQFAAINVTVQNMSGSCIDGATVEAAFLVFNSYMASCNNYGLFISSAQNAIVMGSTVQNNASGGIADASRGISIIGNTIQDNSNFQVQLTPTTIVMGNYFEALPYIFSTNAYGSTYIGNFHGNVAPTAQIYSAAGVPLPACSTTFAHLTPAAVSDATACTSGTTYVSGGSTKCAVQCDGTNWIETGAGAF